MPRKLWEHHDPKSTAMWQFMQECNRRFGLNMQVRHGLSPVQLCRVRGSRVFVFMQKS